LYIDGPGAKTGCRLVLTPYSFEEGQLVVGKAHVQDTLDRIVA
jgi:hypothetical protein